MKRIMLCCSAGMSTSLLVRKMKEVAAQRGEDVQIDAFGASEFDEKFRDYQVVLLGPQVRYMQADLSKRAAEFNIPVEVINMMDYGMQRGDNVLDFAFGLIAQEGSRV
ncbi:MULTISPECIES: PTS sugar transporter subunit IIB [Rahnella]|jgi:PTS system cellobiose-specific IIB component|uniref:PTS sugar transporter subunit IIB n=1 Tax=Rahnella contaminans TaxID=2703882 RepID=A0A6M2B7X9_9GAMM|nr:MULTISPECIES: PTS sugar transporter subunit IIB [Rahnella]KAB8306026.1 PTS sugar transporter subunit IIB [Rouxiella chamberiensis]MBU9819073.1 PTS sugar transporter subunit IIB [Rahnella sp. BCC 1045]MCS3425632.1 PTS system cellobiose-specific IIB component [Rahnella sp. BIGb0603]MDF1896011.1 PTS sugar transporter subunit IIB [Rahnella contaminans]NGX89045.1 PTS sugar transporter subunit IIB [Rahnella contaminans]